MIIFETTYAPYFAIRTKAFHTNNYMPAPTYKTYTDWTVERMFKQLKTQLRSDRLKYIRLL